ncbi:unnamed protein product, partial [Urochloa humidicola]
AAAGDWPRVRARQGYGEDEEEAGEGAERGATADEQARYHRRLRRPAPPRQLRLRRPPKEKEAFALLPVYVVRERTSRAAGNHN